MPDDAMKPSAPLKSPENAFEERLLRAAGSFSYPSTPDLAARLTRQRKPAPARRLAWALVILVLLAALLAAEPVRARVLDWLRLGAVRIFLTDPTLTPLPTGLPAPLPDLFGPTTLDQAAAQAGFTLWLPAGETNPGPPDAVYFQSPNRTPVVILVWLDPNDPTQVAQVLYEIGDGFAFDKRSITSVQETTVNGLPALWIDGPYHLLTTAGSTEPLRLVEGRTLLWTVEERLTFRLETGLPLNQARRWAESLQPVPEK